MIICKFKAFKSKIMKKQREIRFYKHNFVTCRTAIAKQIAVKNDPILVPNYIPLWYLEFMYILYIPNNGHKLSKSISRMNALGSVPCQICSLSIICTNKKTFVVSLDV